MKNPLATTVTLLLIAAFFAWWFGGTFYKSNIREPLSKATAAKADLESKIAELERFKENVPRELATLSLYNSRSLPADLAAAQSLYRMWLIELADFSGFQDTVVEPGRGVAFGRLYYTMGFSVTAQCDLAQLTRFLFEFYAAAHLHRIASLQLTPVRDQEKSLVHVAMTFDTIILPSADRRDRLADGVIRRLTSVQLAGYAPIAERDFMAIRKIRTKADPADFAVITAVNRINGRAEAWLTLRTEAGRILRVREGDVVDVGGFSGRVLSIEGEDLLFDVGGQRWLLTLGDTLRGGFPVPPEF